MQDSPEYIDHYKIIRLIKSGGMADVFLAYEPKLARDVAVKVIAEHIFDDPRTRQLFHQEVQYISKLEHHAIVPLYNSGTFEDKPYLVMRYMPGGSLRRKIGEKYALSIDETSKILKRIVSALEKAHSIGVIHRDIKPANILFDDEGLAYLSDFGIARRQEKNAPSTKAIGTPPYMAPEQWNGEAVDSRTDVYQLGATIFETLTGQVPYQGFSIKEFEKSHLEASVPNACDYNTTLPPESGLVLLRALAKKPSDRFSTPRELANALYRAFGEERIGRFQVKITRYQTNYFEVYQAYDPQTKQNVVLKLLKNRLIEDLTYKLKFRREAERIKSLACEGIVKVYEVSEHNEQPYIVMQQIEGENLYSILKRQQLFDFEAVCKFAKRLASVIDFVHQKNILHRDIRPQNILMDTSGNYFLSDFGTAYFIKQTDAITISRLELDALIYRAPEQWQGETVDKYTDLYQFGVLLFEMLAGQPPFRDNDVRKLREQHLDKPIPSVHAINTTVPKQVDRILAKVLAKKPQERFASAGEISAALENALQEYKLEVLHDRGKYFYHSNQWLQAEKQFKQIVDIEPDYRNVKSVLRRAQEHKRKSDIYEKGRRAFEGKKWEDAIYHLSQIPDYLRSAAFIVEAKARIEFRKLYDRAQSHYRQKAWVDARTLFQEIDSKMPNYEQVDEYLTETETIIARMFQSGKQEYEAGNWVEARQWLTQITGDVDADNLMKSVLEMIEIDELYYKALEEYRLGQLKSAGNTFKQIQRQKPGYKDVPSLLEEINARTKGSKSPRTFSLAKLLTIKRLGLILGILGILLVIAFDFFGFGYKSLRTILFPTSTQPATPTHEVLERCLDEASGLLKVEGLGEFTGEAISLNESPVNMEIVPIASQCPKLQEQVFYDWAVENGSIEPEIGSGFIATYTMPDGSVDDKLTIHLELPNSDVTKDIIFSIMLSSE